MVSAGKKAGRDTTPRRGVWGLLRRIKRRQVLLGLTSSGWTMASHPVTEDDGEASKQAVDDGFLWVIVIVAGML